MDFKRTIVGTMFAGLSVVFGGCAVDPAERADVEVSLDRATIQADGTSFVVSGLTDGAPNSVHASNITFDDDSSSVGGPETNQVKIRCYFCICRDTECRCTEIQCPE